MDDENLRKKILELVDRSKKLGLSDAAKKLGADKKEVYRISEDLSREGLLGMHAGLLGGPQLVAVENKGETKTFEKKKPPKKEKQKKKVLEEYEITSDGINTPIKIVDEDSTRVYKIIMPVADTATGALLDDIEERLISSVEIDATQIFDEKLMDELKTKFIENATNILTDELPHLDDDVKEHFILELIHELIGLEQIDYLLDDKNLEEVVINSASEPVRVYHKKHGWLETNIMPASEARIQNYASIIGRRIGREITTLSPLLDAHLVTKDRANAILAPISTKGNTITIRKFARDPWTVTDFMKNSTVNSDVMALIWLSIQYEMNIMISGGTASGKTSFLNICMPFIQPNHRIISIEDTRELQLPKFLYWCPLTTRQPNPEGKGEVSMLDLLVNSLRMRPDRIVMGEVRKQREAEVMFEAMHTGHSVYCTVHADTCEQTITRLTNPPISIPHTMLDAVHLNVVMFRDRRKGIRRVFEVGEFSLDEMKKQGEGKIVYAPKIVYEWNARSDNTVERESPHRLYRELERHTGLTEKEILGELSTKKMVLDWLVKHDVRDVDDVGKVMKRYYASTDDVVSAIEKDKKPDAVLE